VLPLPLPPPPPRAVVYCYCYNNNSNSHPASLRYTPWSECLPELKQAGVLVVGDPKEKVLAVAEAYGCVVSLPSLSIRFRRSRRATASLLLRRFANAVHVSDYAARHPTLNPFAAARADGTSHTAVANKTMAAADYTGGGAAPWDEGIEAVLVMTDPWDWFETVQVSVCSCCSCSCCPSTATAAAALPVPSLPSTHAPPSSLSSVDRHRQPALLKTRRD